MKRRELQALCKRHGLAAGGSNDDLAARLAATLSGRGGAEEKVVGKGCLKQSGCGSSGGGSGAAKKVTFVFEDEAEVGVRGRSLRSRVVWSPVVAKTRGKRKAGETLPAAEARGSRHQRKGLQVGGDSADEGVVREAGADVPVRRSRRNAVNSGAGNVVERVVGAANRNNSARAEEEVEEVGKAVDRKRKRKARVNAEDIVVSAQVGVSRRSTKSSGLLSAAAVVWSPIVEKKRGRRKAGDVKEQLCVEEQPGRTLSSGSVAAAKLSPVVFESKRSRRKVQEEEPAVLKAAKVDIYARTTRSRSVAAAVVSPIVVENKRRRRRKTDDTHSDGELLTATEVLVNDAHVTRGLRNRAVHVNDGVVEETHVGKKLENKAQPSRPATRRHQQLASSAEQEAQEQVAALSKGPLLRRSRRNQSEANELLSNNNNTTSETNSWSRALVEANGLKTTRPSTCNTAKDSVEDDVAKEDGHFGFTKRNTGSRSSMLARNAGEVSFSDSSGKASAIDKQLEVIEPARTLRQKSVISGGQDFQNAKGEDEEKKQAVKEPVRRSTRKSVVPAMLEKESKGVAAELIPEEYVRRTTRKSVLPNMLNNENKDHSEMVVRSDDFLSAKGDDVEKQPAAREPVRRSTRKSVVPAMLEKERKDIPAEMNPETHVRRSMRKSVLPNMLNTKNKDHGEIVTSEVFLSAKGGDVETELEVKEPVRRSTRKSVVPAMLEKERKDIPAEMNPETHVRRPMRKSVLPNMLNTKNKDHGEFVTSEVFLSAKGGDVETQLEVKEPVRRSTRKSVGPAVLEKENKGLHEEKKSEIPLSSSMYISVAPNVVDKENRNHSEMVRREELGIQKRVQFSAPAMEVDTSENKLQVEVAVQNDGLQQSTRKSLKHNLSDNNAHPGEDKYISRDRVGEGGLKLRKRRRTSTLLSCSSNNSLNTEVFDGQESRNQQKAQTPKKKDSVEDNHEKLAGSHLQSKPTTSTGRPAKRRRTGSHEAMSVEERKVDDMVIRDATQDGDKVTHEYSEESSSNIQDISQDNATGEKSSSPPLLGTLPEETSRVQSVSAEIHWSESDDLDKRGQNSEICHPGAAESTHQREQDQDNSHLSEVIFGELDQSSCLAELVPHAGILSENKALLYEGGVDLGAKGTQTLNAHSSEDGLGVLNKTAGIAQVIRSTATVLILEAEAPLDEGVNNNVMDSIVGIQDLSVALPEQLLEASAKLQTVDEEAPCTGGAVVMENDSHVCDEANWADINSTKGIENVDIALCNDGLEAFKSIAVAEEVPSCTVAGVLDDTPAEEDFQGIGMKNNEASLSLVNTSSHECGSDGQSTKSIEALSLEFNPHYLPTVNAETAKQFDEGCVAEVPSRFLSRFDDTTITVMRSEFAWQKEIQAKHHPPSSDRTNSNDFSIFSGSSKTDVVPIDFTVGDHEEKYPASPVAEQEKISREANTNESVEKTLPDIISTVLHTKDLQHDHRHAPGELVDIVAKETASGSDVNSHQCICPTEHDECDNRPEDHSGAVAEKSIKDADLGQCLSNDKEENSLSATLHVEGVTEDESMFLKLSDVDDVEECSSDGRHSSFGLKLLFAEDDKESYLINDENTARNCKTPIFYPGSDCSLEDEDVQLIGGDADKKLDVEQSVVPEECIAEDISMLPILSAVDVCSSYGRRSLFGQKALFAEEGTGSYVTNDACVSAEIDCKKKLNDEIFSVYLESDCSLKEKDVGLVTDNPDYKLTKEQVQQDDVQEGTLEKISLGSVTPEYKDEFGLPEKAVLHSTQNERCSSSAEQTPFGLQSLFSQESIEQSMEYGAHSFARGQAESGVDESKDCHVKCRVEKALVSGPVSDHDTRVDFSVVSKNGDHMYTSQQDNEKEGSPKSSHEEQVASGHLGLLEAANCMEEGTNSEEVAWEDEKNRKPVHSMNINSSCEKSDSNGPVEHASCISDALLSSSQIAPANYNDEVHLSSTQSQVHLSSTQSQLQSTGFLDEPTGCSNTEVLHQGPKEQRNEHKEGQVASGAHTSDMIEAASAKDIEREVTLLAAEERSVFRGKQLNSKLEGTEVAESGVSCDNDVSYILEFGSAVNNVGKRTPSDSNVLPNDSSMDHCQQQDLSNDFSVEKSPEEYAMCWENSVSRAGDNVPGTCEKPSFNLTIPDCKHESAMSGEAVHSLKNVAGRCSSNLKYSPIMLKFLFSLENMEGSGTHDALAFPSAENGVDESNVCHVGCQVVSSEPDSYKWSDEYLSGVKENGGSMFSSQQDNEQDGFFKIGHEKDWVSSAQLESSEDVNNTEREIIAKEVVCKEEEKRGFMPLDIDSPHEKSHVNEHAEYASGVSGIQYCSSRSTPICDEVHLSFNSSQLESLDASDNLIAFSNTEVVYQDYKEECNRNNEDQVTRDIPASDKSEAAPVEGSENGITLLPVADISALPDKQLNPKLEGDEIDLGSGICQTGVEITTELLSFNTEVLHQDHQEERNEHDEVTQGIIASGMSESPPIEGLESETTLLPAAETSLPDEQLDELEGNEVVQQSLSCNKYTRSVSDTGSVEDNLSNLPKDSYMDSCHEEQLPNDPSAPKSIQEPAICLDDNVHMDCFHEQEPPSDPPAPKSPKESAFCQGGSVQRDCFHEQELPSDLSAPKSPEESAICRDDGVSESVGICQTSGRRRIGEISTKLPSFKISSTVKGSYIAMNAPPTTKQGDNLSQSAIALLRNRENTPAVKTGHPVKPNPDRSAVKNSSRRALQKISGRPRGWRL